MTFIQFSLVENAITALGHQAAVLVCVLAGVPVTAVSRILDMDDKPVFRIFANLEVTGARHVEKKEKDIVYGKVEKWCDVEADEVELGKELCEDGSSLKWGPWGASWNVATQRQ